MSYKIRNCYCSEYQYSDEHCYKYKGYTIRKTHYFGPDNRRIYQIDGEPIDLPKEKMYLTTLKKTKEYIDKRIAEESLSQPDEQRTDKFIELIDKINELKADGRECHIKIEITLK